MRSGPPHAEREGRRIPGKGNALPGGLDYRVFSDLDLNAVRLGFEASAEFFANG
jgi:hypothetical protein